ncbi:MAG: TRAP transporter substrate-binding protein [Clostridia bacterium]|nr:TRAP transporter substrate-binding protein [Clostridia bacterium]
MKRIFARFAAALAVLSCCVLPFASAAAEERDPVAVSLSLACPGPAESVAGVWARMFAEKTAELSNGTVLVTVFADGVLGTDPEVARACRYGSVDLMIARTTEIAGVAEGCMLADVPFLFRDTAHAGRVFADARIRSVLAESLLESGLVLLSTTEWGMENIGLTNPPGSEGTPEGVPAASAADPCRQAVLTALGYRPVVTEISDVCLAVRQHAVLAQESTPEMFYRLGIYETQKYLTDSRHFVSVGTLCAGSTGWESLSEETRACLLRAAAETEDAVNAAAEAENERLLRAMRSVGIRVTEAEISDERRNAAAEAATALIAERLGTETAELLLAVADELK